MDVLEEGLRMLLGVGQEVEIAVVEREPGSTLEDAYARTTQRIVDASDLVRGMGHV
jgi:hypothetical protein